LRAAFIALPAVSKWKVVTYEVDTLQMIVFRAGAAECKGEVSFYISSASITLSFFSGKSTTSS
jgi:hypothetical protein